MSKKKWNERIEQESRESREGTKEQERNTEKQRKCQRKQRDIGREMAATVAVVVFETFIGARRSAGRKS